MVKMNISQIKNDSIFKLETIKINKVHLDFQLLWTTKARFVLIREKCIFYYDSL